jgi:hypothetical protein
MAYLYICNKDMYAGLDVLTSVELELEDIFGNTIMINKRGFP